MMIKNFAKTCAAVALGTLLFTSCQPQYTLDATGMQALEQDVMKEFGDTAYYTYVSYMALNNDNAYGINVHVSTIKEDVKQKSWIHDGDRWYEEGPVTMQLGANTADFYKFQLGKGDHLKKLGDYTQRSLKDFSSTHASAEPKVTMALVNTLNTVTDVNDKYRYTVMIKDKKSETTANFTYNGKGDLLNSN